MKGLATFGLSIFCIGLACAGLGNTSCSSNSSSGDDDDGTNSGDSGTSYLCTGDAGTLTYAGSAGQACVAPPATIPDPECDDAVQAGSADGVESLCPATPPSPACNLAACPISTEAGSCEPLATNPAAGPWNFRMRRIIVAAPPNLATTLVQGQVVTSGVDMNEIACGEKGTGAFSWLISLDPTKKTIKTGGAPPCDIPNPVAGSTPGTWSCDPFTTGYCFVNKTLGNLAIGPASGTVKQNCDGSWSTVTQLPTLNIPIYYQGSIITLPISYGAMTGLKITDNGNCIGSFNPSALNSDCSDGYLDCSKWDTAGSLTGFITLATADTVKVDLLGESLCVLLTNTPGVADSTGFKYCKKNADNTIAEQGDYCSTTQSAATDGGTCADSFWLAATFAASAVNINDGTTSGPDGGPNPDCLGNGSQTPDDAGTDSAVAPASDGGADAASSD